MLQQTRVATVIPYFNCFLREFPTIRSLARARRERVLELWSGLGYYRRARDLHRAAQVVVKKFNGHFPRTYEAARSLPGVGDYTARAVLSIAFDQPFAVLEGNVARVVARWRAIRGHVQQQPFRKKVSRLLDRWLARRRPGAFNQALMELGQTCCLPRNPRCPVCPLSSTCRALKLGRPESFPAPRPRRASEVRHLAIAAIHRGAKFALVRGLDEGLLPELWNFPAAFGASSAAARRALAGRLEDLSGAGFNGAIAFEGVQNEFHHTITHRSILAQVHQVKVSSLRRKADMRPRSNSPSIRWLTLSELDSAAISALARKVAAFL